MFVRTSLLTLLTGTLLMGRAEAVGLGPLSRNGITDGPGKAFYLTLTNPYGHAETFEALAVANDDESSAPRVVVIPAISRLRPNGARRLLVIVNDLEPGERFAFRVCAARPPKLQETVYARVCSHLVARRLAARN